MDTQDLDDFTGLFVGHYGQLVRMAALLLGDVEAAEDVAQEAFIRVHRMLGRGRVSDPRAYLRQAVDRHTYAWSGVTLVQVGQWHATIHAARQPGFLHRIRGLLLLARQ
ncbi:MAG TPA: sigma factor [Streptosporangiaceae bacterium]